MWLKELRETTTPTTQITEIVPIIKELYPKYDAQLHSKVERPDSYGIDLRHDAEAAVRKYFGQPAEEPKPATPGISLKTSRKPDYHRKPCSVRCRLTQEEYDHLQTIIQQDGYSTVQEWLHQLIFRHLKRRTKSTTKSR